MAKEDILVLVILGGIIIIFVIYSIWDFFSFLLNLFSKERRQKNILDPHQKDTLGVSSAGRAEALGGEVETTKRLVSSICNAAESGNSAISTQKLSNEDAGGTEPTENSKYLDLRPGETVPKSGEWKCNWCGEGGHIDSLLTVLVEGHQEYRNFRTPVAVKLYKAWLRESMAAKEMRGIIGSHMNDSQIDGRETIGFFTEGEKFSECPNCGPTTGWILLESADDIVGKLWGTEYQVEDPQLQIYDAELRDLRISIRNNHNKAKCYLCGNIFTILFPVIEQWILGNRVKEAEIRNNLAVKSTLFAPNLTRDGAVCKQCKAVMCGVCAEEIISNYLHKETPKCKLCGNVIYGIDHITD